MSDSGFGNIASPARPAPQAGAGRGGIIVQITSLPDGLQDSAKAIRLAGEITQTNKNGTARISTNKGEIEVQIKGNRQPQNGQRIEIEIPAGRQPRQATVRETPSLGSSRADNQPTQQTNTNTPNLNNAQPSPQQIERTVIAGTRIVATTPQELQTVQNTAQQTRVTSASQPLPPALQEAIAQNTASTAPPRPVTIDATLRLISVPPAQAQNIAAEYLQALPQPQQNLLTRVDFNANLIAQKAQDQLGQSLLQTIRPAAIPATITTPVIPTATALTLQPQNLLQTTLNNSFLNTLTPTTTPTLISPAQPALAGTAPLQPNLISGPLTTAPTIPNVLTIPPSLAAGLLAQLSSAQLPTTPTASTAPQMATLTPLPLTFDPTNPATIIPRLTQQIDINILKITPPQVALIPPTGAGQTTAQNAQPFTLITPPLGNALPAVATTAQVIGFLPGNLPLVSVQWPSQPLPQNFALQFNSSNLQIGTQLQVIPRTITAPLPTLTGLIPTTATNPLLPGFQWPALDELYNGLLQISSQAASSLSRTLPNAGNPSQIAPAAMMFVAALKSGDLASLIGDKKLDMLQRADRSSIMSRLSMDGGGATRTAAPEQAPSSDWRAVPLPMFWEGAIHKITLYTRNEQQQSRKEGNKNGQTRFIFDLSLSRMGDVQLDGLLRDNRLDLVVRTQNAFSLPMQQTMKQAYTAALDSTELTGDLNFQGSTNNWVHVLQEQEQLGVHA